MSSEFADVYAIRQVDWEGFGRAVRQDVGRPRARRLYRGQSDPSWSLESPLQRAILTDALSLSAYQTFQDGFRERFIRLATGLPGVEQRVLRPVDWWILGRHYGLITPILDWTESPYVAAFFSAADFIEKHNPGLLSGGFKWGQGLTHGTGEWSVWELTVRPDWMLAEEADGDQPFSIIEPRIDFAVFAHRIKAQRSLFTQLNELNHRIVEAYLAHTAQPGLLVRYDIQYAYAFEALKHLDLMNINYSSLFPDLEGAARQANLGDLYQTFGP